MKNRIILGICLFIAVLTILIGTCIAVITSNNSKETIANVEETPTIEEPKEVFYFTIDNSETLGGENQEISLAELEKMEEEKLEQSEQEEQEETEPEEIETVDPQQVPEEENTHEENPASGEPEYPTGNSPYYIKVNNEANVVTIYGKDENGYYSVPVKAMICSTGTVTPPSYRYPSNKYEIQGRWEWLDLINDVYGHYATQITGNILFHSVPYTEKWNPGSLEWWEYDKLRNSLFSWMCKIKFIRCMVDIPLCTIRYNSRVLL